MRDLADTQWGWSWIWENALDRIAPVLCRQEINKEQLVANLHRIDIFYSAKLGKGGGGLYEKTQGGWLISVSAQSDRLTREKTIWHEFSHWIAIIGRDGTGEHDAGWIEIVTALGLPDEAKRETRMDVKFYRLLAGRAIRRALSDNRLDLRSYQATIDGSAP